MNKIKFGFSAFTEDDVQYFKNIALETLGQIGPANLATLKAHTFFEVGVFTMERVSFPTPLLGLIFEDLVNDSACIIIGYYQDYYQVAVITFEQMKAFLMNEKSEIEVEEVHQDIDCFQLADLLGRLRKKKMVTRFVPHQEVSEIEGWGEAICMDGKHQPVQ